MSKVMLPAAREIWNMRLAGKKPNNVVFVSLIGELNVGPCVAIPQDVRPENCEWRWVVDLSVTLVFDETVNKERMWRTCQSILRNAPNGGYAPFSKHLGYLWMWNTSSKIASQLNWWRGIEPVPEWDVDGIPEEFSAHPVSRWDMKTFDGVEAA